MFCKKGVFRNFAKFTRKHLCQSLFFNKVAASLKKTTLLKKETWHWYVPVNFVKLLRITFFIEHLRWLLLNLFFVLWYYIAIETIFLVKVLSCFLPFSTDKILHVTLNHVIPFFYISVVLTEHMFENVDTLFSFKVLHVIH